MSHLKEITIYECQECGNRAKFFLINDRSTRIGVYCKRHADHALKSFNNLRKKRIFAGASR